MNASAGAAYNAAVDSYNVAKAKSFDIKNSVAGDFNTVVEIYKLDSAIEAISNTSADTDINNTAVTAATYSSAVPVEDTYVVKVTGLTTDSEFLNGANVRPLGAANAAAGTDTLRAILAQKNIDLSDAQTAADTLNAGAGETFTIDIFLDKQVGKNNTNTWKYIPVENETTKARFYLNSILNGGATSTKLVDEVVLGSDVSGKFKNLVFDLDVSLSSAQVTYEADNTLSTTATTNTFTNATATVAQDGTVTWS